MRIWGAVQRVVALGCLVVLTPLLAVVALAVRVRSAGPAIYRGRRVGRNGEPIVIHKFRTMSNDSEVGPPITAGSDERVTDIGRFLRRSRLDELPQLWDVARGAMALVGPRPEAPEYVDLADPRWAEILDVPPGITGRTQLEFLDERRLLTGRDYLADYRDFVLPRKLASDLAYVRSRSVAGDLHLLALTIGRLIKRGSA